LVAVAVGVLDGEAVGVLVAVAVGVFVPVAVGDAVGVALGVFVGVFVGVADGVFVGVFVGVLVGEAVGVLVGVGVGVLATPVMVIASRSIRFRPPPTFLNSNRTGRRLPTVKVTVEGNEDTVLTVAPTFDHVAPLSDDRQSSHELERSPP
jgi:hypothetical protein